MGWSPLGSAFNSFDEAAQMSQLLAEKRAGSEVDDEDRINLALSRSLANAKHALIAADRERGALLNEIHGLSVALADRQIVVKSEDAYYLSVKGHAVGDAYCLVCWEKDHTLIHLVGRDDKHNTCPICSSGFLLATTQPKIAPVDEPELPAAAGGIDPHALELLNVLLEKVMSVNSFFITAGYTTFFGMAILTKHAIPPAYFVTATLFLMMSAALFVGHHLIGLLTMSVMARSIADPSPGAFQRSLHRLAMESGRVIQRTGIPLTMVSALLAAVSVVTLGIAMLRNLSAVGGV